MVPTRQRAFGARFALLAPQKKYKTYVGICDAYVCEVETNFVFLLKFYASTQPLQREGSLI